MRGILVRDIREFQKRMEERGIYLGVEEAHDILDLADDMPDADDIARRFEYDPSCLGRLYKKRTLSRIRALEDKVAELAKSSSGCENIIHCCDCADCYERTEHNAILGTDMTRLYCNGPLNLSQMEAPEVQPDDFCSFAIQRQ